MSAHGAYGSGTAAAGRRGGSGSRSGAEGGPGAGGRPGGRRRFSPGYDSWELIWGHVHRVLVVNAGLALANLPLLAALEACHRPWRHPLPFLLLACAAGPSLAAAFGYLHAAQDDERAPLTAYLRAYRRLARRALALWSPFVLLAAVAATDAAALRGSALALAVAPPAAVLVAGAAGAGLVSMAHLAGEDPAVSGRTYLVAAYSVLRRWPFALMNLAVLAAALLIVDLAPLAGLATVPGCALFVVWRNAREMLAATLPDGPAR